MSLTEAMHSEVTRDQTDSEICRNDLDPTDFFAEIGDRPWYTGAEVLHWLATSPTSSLSTHQTRKATAHHANAKDLRIEETYRHHLA